jgi:hypothetical protein
VHLVGFTVRSESRCALRLRYVDFVQACIDTRRHHFQHLLQAHSDFPNADLQKVFANKIKRVQACIDARRHHFQHLLQAHSDFPNADLQKVFANKIKRVQACIIKFKTTYTVPLHLIVNPATAKRLLAIITAGNSCSNLPALHKDKPLLRCCSS